MRLMFIDATPDFQDVVAPLVPHAEFASYWKMPAGKTVFVAYDPSHLDRYDAWFQGVGIRVRARERATPLEPRHALYVPVTYDSWLVFASGLEGIPVALETAKFLPSVDVVVCPAFDPLHAPTVLGSHDPPRRYTRFGDRVRLKT